MTTQRTAWPRLRLLRPHQWTKNILCLAGVFFSGKWSDTTAWHQSCIVVAAFCAASSFVYIVNDIFDREQDRLHRTKQRRPLASGELGVTQAMLLAMVCLCIVCVLSCVLRWGVIGIIFGYITLHLFYSLRLKNIALIDVMILSIGFILRLLAGTAAANVRASEWILLCTFFLALFMGFAKRRAEINNWGDQAESSRLVLGDYTIQMLDRFCNITGTLTIACYALFTVLAHSGVPLVLTCPPAVFGVFRYILLVERKAQGEAPENLLLNDRPIQAALIIWFLTYAVVLYGSIGR